jgi:hypothetical protein
MKYLHVLLVALTSGAIVGCASTKPELRQSIFGFDYGGERYQIISVVVADEGGYNHLVRRDAERYVLHARDYDQDGELDTLLIGDVTLEQANRIYAAGIEQAKIEGRFRSLTNTRLYEVELPEGVCTILTFPAGLESWTNRFTFVEAETQVLVTFLDLTANGSLDRVEGGAGDLAIGQALYTRALQRGLREDRVELDADTYRVLPTHPGTQRPASGAAPPRGPSSPN